jgi:hypothetical protein
MENSLDNSAEGSLVAPADSKAKAALRRLWKFPRSWKEVKALGWKFILAFVLFYLIRDTILYILIPYLVYKGIIAP